ncbi:MAG: hypothetical protein EHM28_00225 [Spirochaetaceae bacterium]|nr:MAG: hypothetical protein EHM28_00225 [Spirochaetaceae bacterium]
MSDQGSGKSLPIVPSGFASLILGISGCCFGWLYGFPGIILSVIGMILAGKGKRAVAEKPNGYRMANIAKAGGTWSLVGLIQGIILTVIYMAVIIMAVIYNS